VNNLPGKKKKKEVDYTLEDRWKGLDLTLMPIDEIDIRILSILRENSKQTNLEIANRLQTSEATIRRRINTLIQKGIIHGFSVYIDYSLIENSVKAYIHLKVDSGLLEKIVKKIKKHKRVIALYRVTGEYDLLCVTLFVNMTELQEFIDKYLKIKGIKHCDTQIVMSAHKGVPWTGI